MAESLDMSLDEIIKNRKTAAASRGRGKDGDRKFVSGVGPVRRFANRGPPRPQPYVSPMVQQQIQHQLFAQGAASHSNSEGTRLYISNLDYGVTNEDIQVLFSEVGDLKRSSVHYDRSGRSKGTAEVVFKKQSDALAALKRYDNVQLDGKPMKIELVGMNIVAPAPIPIPLPFPPTPIPVPFPMAPFSRGILADPRAVAPRRFNGRQVRPMNMGGGPRGVGRSREQGRNENVKLSAEDLDADLEKYRLEALRIS